MTREEYKENNQEFHSICENCGCAADLGREDFRYVVHKVTGQRERLWLCDECKESIAIGTDDGYELAD